MSIFLKNISYLIDMRDDDVKENFCIGISNKKIDYVGQYIEGLDNKYETVIECKDKAVMPGMFNTHCHAAMTLFRNYADDMSLMDWLFKKIVPLEDKLDNDAVYWGTQLAAVEMIKSGTVAFADMYFFIDSVAEAVCRSGMKALLSRGLQGSGYNRDEGKLRENLETHRRYHNACDGNIKIGFGPHSVYTADYDYLRCVSEIASEKHIPIQVHASETISEVKGCLDKYGISPIKLLDKAGLLNSTTIAAHCVVVDDEDMEILKSRGVSVAHNPSSNMKLASGIAPIEEMVNKGIRVCLGTDGAASNNCLDMFKEMREASYLQKVLTLNPEALSVDTAIKMATVNGAKAMGFYNSGLIEEGKDADIIIINIDKEYYYPRNNIKSALVYSSNSTDVETSIISGKIVMKNRNMLTLDEKKIYSMANKAFKSLC